jgi:hypothetical protein
MMYKQYDGVSPALLRLSAQAASGAAAGAGSSLGLQQPNMKQVGPMNGGVTQGDVTAANQATGTSHQWPGTEVRDAGSGQGQSVVREQPMQQPVPRRMQPVQVDGDMANQQLHPQQASSYGALGDNVVGCREPLQALQPGQMPQVQHAELDKVSSRTPSADNIATG